MKHFNSLRTATNQREKMYVLEMLDLILPLDIGFLSYVARAFYTFENISICKPTCGYLHFE